MTKRLIQTTSFDDRNQVANTRENMCDGCIIMWRPYRFPRESVTEKTV